MSEFTLESGLIIITDSPMSSISVAGEDLPIRPELAIALREARVRLSQAGTWWTGEERRFISLEARHASQCRLCLARKAALSPYAIVDDYDSHDVVTDLTPSTVEAIHRLATDSGRLTEKWVHEITSSGLTEEAYVEIVGIVAVVTALDTFDYALGMDSLQDFNQAQSGEPDKHRPAGAKSNLAWVHTLAPEDVQQGDPNPYPVHGQANIHRGLSLVPREVFNFFDLDVELYLHDDGLRDFDNCPRSINRAQIELIAGRASAINNCFY